MSNAPHTKKFLALIVAVLAFSLSLSPVLAEDLSSGDYILKDPSFSANEGGGATSANYGAYASMDEFVYDARFSSTNYQVRAGVVNTWQANVPVVKCFETTSSGSTNCDDPDVTNGMVEICGQGGCYNKARFEIDPQNNPSDTVYSVRITTDPTWTTWNYVDGTTFLIESAGTHGLSDYLTESSWEGTASSFNIFGLQPNTTYYIKLTALHGDYTESAPGPSANTTTSTPQLAFDLDIATTAGTNTETATPYAVSLGTLQQGVVNTSSNLIWMDVGTNTAEGASVFVRSQYGGLYTASGSYTLTSADANLASSPGFGIQEYTATQTYLGPLSAEPTFDVAGDNVGGLIPNIYGRKLLTSSGAPVHQGRAGFYVKARPAETSPANNDYTDTLIFTISGDL